MVRINQDYEYETPFQGPYEIFQAWTNGTVTIQTESLLYERAQSKPEYIYTT